MYLFINVHTLNHEIKHLGNLNYTCMCSPSDIQTSDPHDYANNFGIYLLCGSSKQIITVTSLRAKFNNWNPHGPFQNLYKTEVRGPGLSHSKYVKMKMYKALKVIQYFPVDEFEPSKEHQIYQDKNKAVCVMSLSVACKRAEVCSEICCNCEGFTGILILGMIQEHLPRHQ